jgi:hypothetical protein
MCLRSGSFREVRENRKPRHFRKTIPKSPEARGSLDIGGNANSGHSQRRLRVVCRRWPNSGSNHFIIGFIRRERGQAGSKAMPDDMRSAGASATVGWEIGWN